jgi:hypothetical protein
MTTKLDKIAALKLEYPTLKSGSDETGYTDLTDAEYQATIEAWADSILAKEAKAEAEIAKAHERSALLAKLGITEEEAALLLGGN